MFRRCIMMAALASVAALVLVAPAQAGGWAVVTLDSLPREVRAGQRIEIGFVVRQHGQKPTNQDLDGKPLKPILVASKQATTAATSNGGSQVQVAARTSGAAKGEETIRVAARQEGATGHFVADVTFPGDGVWAWQIEVPTFYVQNGTGGPGGSAVFDPLTVLPAAARLPQPAEAAFLNVNRAAVRWIGLTLVLFAAGVALFAWQSRLRSRRPARSL